MNKEKFKELFFAALEESTSRAEQRLNLQLPRVYEIELHWLGFNKELLDADTVADFLYLGDDEFLVIVDVAVLGASSTITRQFVRPSGHWPRATIEETWGGAEKGPFKQMDYLQFFTIADDR